MLDNTSYLNRNSDNIPTIWTPYSDICTLKNKKTHLMSISYREEMLPAQIHPNDVFLKLDIEALVGQQTT